MAFNTKLVQKARKLRKSSTIAEIKIWEKLKTRQLKNYRFLRQKIIGNYIVDFYCCKLKLAIEIDGQYHQNRCQEDRNRQKTLELAGITIVRFTNAEVHSNLNRVLQVIHDKIEVLEIRGIKERG
ncbi:endonuclease domain-containing protein [candidate division CSSED10-310 bacterium]|uniref:Endonuclease domain-containing protein n=1 Tax=candidate division CSSED10-310 bacterium TaxID=2855610 RepID=A0ABV6YZD3_UNCC1